MMRDSHFILGVSRADAEALKEMYGGKYDNKVFLFSDLAGRHIDFGDPFHQKDFDVGAAERMLKQMEEICDSQEHLSVDSGEPWHESMFKRLQGRRRERELAEMESELRGGPEKM